MKPLSADFQRTDINGYIRYRCASESRTCPGHTRQDAFALIRWWDTVGGIRTCRVQATQMATLAEMAKH